MREFQWSEITSYFGLTIFASSLIYASAHDSLNDIPSSPSSSSSAPSAASNSAVAPVAITTGEAWLMPLIGSVVLVSLWLMLTYLNGDLIRFLFTIYFCILGTGSVWKTFHSISRKVLGKEYFESFKTRRIRLQFPLYGFLDLDYTTPDILLGILSILPSILYFIEKSQSDSIDNPTLAHAFLSNIIAASLAFGMLEFLKLDGFKTGCILLSGLFFYDIWWVFGTTVMMDVAKGIDAPILILWPRSFVENKGFSMLGLGDIVLPGSFISLCLQYDHYRSQKRRLSTKTQPFKKTYFSAVLLAYFIGLNVTSLVVQFVGRAQPALLYLSPACIGTLLVTAWKKNEISGVFRWENSVEGNRNKDSPAEAEDNERQTLLGEESRDVNTTLETSSSGSELGTHGGARKRDVIG